MQRGKNYAQKLCNVAQLMCLIERSDQKSAANAWDDVLFHIVTKYKMYVFNNKNVCGLSPVAQRSSYLR